MPRKTQVGQANAPIATSSEGAQLGANVLPLGPLQTAQTIAEVGPHGSPSAARLMLELWRVAADRLDDNQLAWVSSAAEMGLVALENVRTMVESMAIQVRMDSEHERAGRPTAGLFEGIAGAPVLESISASLDAAAGLIAVGMEAESLRKLGVAPTSAEVSHG